MFSPEVVYTASFGGGGGGGGGGGDVKPLVLGVLVSIGAQLLVPVTLLATLKGGFS